MTVNRRSFLKGAAAGAAGTALSGGLLAESARRDAAAADTAPARQDAYPFHGPHQSGILLPAPGVKQASACFASFDVTATGAAGLASLLQTLTARARTLTAGGAAPDLGVGQPPADSDVLGPEIPADGLTVTVGFGASLFDDRFGLAKHRPASLTSMRVFPNDSPEPAWTGGDVLVQLCANSPDTVHHALRDLTRHTRGGMQLRWRMEGFNPPPRPAGAARNLLGFKDGTANPTGGRADDLVWVDDGGAQPWTVGGSYLVVRNIRMLVEFWDRVSINEQENMFGRRRDSGAPLDGNVESDVPDYVADPKGHVIPLDSHIRLANPRTPTAEAQQLIRRSYTYDRGVDTNGNLDVGHVFVCFQKNIQDHFEVIQERLVDEPLVDYVQPFGGGYFFVPAGLADDRDWYLRSLLA